MIMPRKKLNLEYITADSARKAAFKKRKRGLFKKMNEITILCGINACVVIYSPFDSQPEIWPPSHMVVHHVLTKFKAIPEIDRAKKMSSFEGYIMERIEKANMQRRRLRKDSREQEMTQVMNQCLAMKNLVSTLSIMDVHDLKTVIDNRARMISERIEELKGGTEQQLVTNSFPQPHMRLETLPMDGLHPDSMYRPMAAPQQDQDDGFIVDEMVNPYGNNNINIDNISNDYVRPNNFYD